FFHTPVLHRDLHSFPTRRSSELWIFRSTSWAAVIVDPDQRRGSLPKRRAKHFTRVHEGRGLGPRRHQMREQVAVLGVEQDRPEVDRKSTRLNSCHVTM